MVLEQQNIYRSISAWGGGLSPDPLFSAIPRGKTCIPMCCCTITRHAVKGLPGKAAAQGCLLSVGSLLLEYRPSKSPWVFLPEQHSESPMNTIPDTGAALDAELCLSSPSCSTWVLLDSHTSSPTSQQSSPREHLLSLGAAACQAEGFATMFQKGLFHSVINQELNHCAPRH